MSITSEAMPGDPLKVVPHGITEAIHQRLQGRVTGEHFSSKSLQFEQVMESYYAHQKS